MRPAAAAAAAADNTRQVALVVVVDKMEVKVQVQVMVLEGLLEPAQILQAHKEQTEVLVMMVEQAAAAAAAIMPALAVAHPDVIVVVVVALVAPAWQRLFYQETLKRLEIVDILLYPQVLQQVVVTALQVVTDTWLFHGASHQDLRLLM
jgi:hypothetical protein